MPQPRLVQYFQKIRFQWSSSSTHGTHNSASYLATSNGELHVQPKDARMRMSRT